MADSVEELRQRLADKASELAGLRFDREQRQRQELESIERNQLRAQIERVEADIAVEKGYLKTLEEQDSSRIAGAAFPEPANLEPQVAEENTEENPEVTPVPPEAPQAPGEGATSGTEGNE